VAELSVVGHSIAAAIAIFRFEVGMIPTLAASCIAGVVPYFVGAISAEQARPWSEDR
jgi:hypothetical protein